MGMFSIASSALRGDIPRGTDRGRAMSDQQAKNSEFWKWMAILVSALSIPSMAESLVTYVEWFQIGFIEPLQRVKAALRAALYWVPFTLPEIWPEYVMMGLAFWRAVIVGQQTPLPSMGIQLLPLMIIGWPFWFFMTIFAVVSELRANLNNKQSRQILLTFILSLAFGVAIIFATSDALQRLGWA